MERWGHSAEAVGDATYLPSERDEIWIDVGAHRGDEMLAVARSNPNITVYAFEPNIHVAQSNFGQVKNYILLPLAVSETDGFARFNLNTDDRTSSLHEVDQASLSRFTGVEPFSLLSQCLVHTIRLDTFMNGLDVQRVDFLKIDAQGHDVAVLRSLGKRMAAVERIQVEAWTERSQYRDADNQRDAVVAYLIDAGFDLVGSQSIVFGQYVDLMFVRRRGTEPI